jgi:hypothetical protein
LAPFGLFTAGLCDFERVDRVGAVNLSTIKLLREWAKWGEAQNICYPSMSPMFGERALKTALFGIGYIPPDVMRVEWAVCRLEWELRFVLILRYQRHLPWGRIGRCIDRDWRTAKARTQAAENEVHHKLNGNASLIVGRKVRFVRLFKTVSTRSSA